MVEEIGGVRSYNCNSFLDMNEDYDPEVGLVSGINTQQHRAVLFPIKTSTCSATTLHFVKCKHMH